ncbi:MAG: hypothetical protein HQ557_02070 [Bacteroidetes bacterium]|nr:hypothetical protein [Bacteroidota bacterium]
MKEVVLNVDYYDMVNSSTTLYDESRIETFFSKCVAKGVTTVLWRLSICGVAGWHSKVRSWYNAKYVNAPNSYNMVRILRKFDPLEVACRIGKDYGIKVFAWITMMDEDATPGLISDFVLEHTEYTWRSHDQRRYLRGALCYAYPEVQEFRRKELEEILSYDLDGVYLCTRSHAKHANESRDLDDFGYNAPIVQEYKQRYSIDILAEEFDKLKLYDLQGEYFTDFVRTASEMIRGRGLPLWMGIHSDGYSMMNISPMGHMKLDYELWIDENLIDGLIVAAGEPILDRSEVWFRKTRDKFNFLRKKGKLLICWFRVWDWRNELPYLSEETKNPELIRDVKRKYASFFDGYAYHESENFERYEELWECIQHE